MFDTCFVCSVVVSEDHKNKRPFSLSLSQSWNKRDKHSPAKNGRTALKIEKRTTTAERWQISKRHHTFPHTISIASKLLTGNQNRSFLWNTCQALVSNHNILSAVTPSWIVQWQQVIRTGNFHHKWFSSLFVSRQIFLATCPCLLFALREEIAGVSGNLEKLS